MNAKNHLTLDRLLHIDGLAALTVGIFLLAVREPFSALLGLPVWLLTLQGILNLCYANYSLPLARLMSRPALICQKKIWWNPFVEESFLYLSFAF